MSLLIQTGYRKHGGGCFASSGEQTQECEVSWSQQPPGEHVQPYKRASEDF